MPDWLNAHTSPTTRSNGPRVRRRVAQFPRACPRAGAAGQHIGQGPAGHPGWLHGNKMRESGSSCASVPGQPPRERAASRSPTCRTRIGWPAGQARGHPRHGFQQCRRATLAARGFVQELIQQRCRRGGEPRPGLSAQHLAQASRRPGTAAPHPPRRRAASNSRVRRTSSASGCSSLGPAPLAVAAGQQPGRTCSQETRSSSRSRLSRGDPAIGDQLGQATRSPASPASWRRAPVAAAAAKASARMLNSSGPGSSSRSPSR